MSLTELKEAAAQLEEKERAELSAHLIVLGRRKDRAWSEELSRRMDDMDSGKSVSQAEFEKRVADPEG